MAILLARYGRQSVAAGVAASSRIHRKGVCHPADSSAVQVRTTRRDSTTLSSRARMSSRRRDALSELAQLAADAGPALVPVGHRELLLQITETARRLFSAMACSLAL